jgi:hypothetical protein
MGTDQQNPQVPQQRSLQTPSTYVCTQQWGGGGGLIRRNQNANKNGSLLVWFAVSEDSTSRQHLR